MGKYRQTAWIIRKPFDVSVFIYFRSAFHGTNSRYFLRSPQTIKRQSMTFSIRRRSRQFFGLPCETIFFSEGRLNTYCDIGFGHLFIRHWHTLGQGYSVMDDVCCRNISCGWATDVRRVFGIKKNPLYQFFFYRSRTVVIEYCFTYTIELITYRRFEYKIRLPIMLQVHIYFIQYNVSSSSSSHAIEIKKKINK